MTVDDIRSAELCSFVRDFPVVHLSNVCLPNYASHLITPVLSVPSAQRGKDTNTFSHVSFMDGEGSISQLQILVDVARMMNWKSAVYVGDMTPGQRKMRIGFDPSVNY